MALSRVPTVLPDELEDLIHRTIGTCIAVHAALGPGLLESLYSRALATDGLLLNFNAVVLKQGLRRVVL